MSYHTRPRPLGTPERVERVAYLMQRMSDGTYYGHKTCLELADAWKLSFQTVRQDANDAGMILKVKPEEIDARKEQMSAWFLHVAETALTKLNKITGLPDFKAANEAMTRYGIYSGIADKVELEQKLANVAPVKIEIVTVERPAKDMPKKVKKET